MEKNVTSLEFDERAFLKNNENYKIHLVDNLEKMYSKIHDHDFIEIFILLSGSVTYVIEQGNYELKDFDIILVPPHTIHQLTVTKNDVKYKRLVLWIRKQYLDRLSSEKTYLLEQFMKHTKNNHYVIRNPEFTFKIKPFLEKIIELDKNKEYGYDLLIENTFRELFIYANIALENEYDIVTSKGNPIVQRIIKYIEEHLSNELSLKEISDVLNFDEFYISHLFKKEVGTTIHKYVVRKRLSEAKKLLEKNYSVKDLISLIGFKDESHFIQCFKDEYGFTPKQYKLSLEPSIFKSENISKQ